MNKIEALKTSVEMWVWDEDKSCKQVREVVFINEDGGCIVSNGVAWDNCEPIKEPTYRPYREGDDISHLLGAKVAGKDDSTEVYLITGIHPKCEDKEELVLVGNSWMSFENLFREFTFLDGTPIGVKE